MKACGVIVEYNPFHNGHVYHVESSRDATNADCVIAVMSGNFLQRGEPAIIDKWHRTQAALQTGVDLVIELPYVFAVQHADLFAKGAVLTLDALKAQSVCFGSEHGKIESFISAYKLFKAREKDFSETLKVHLKKGLSFPEASRIAYGSISLNTDELDLTQPNNILGFSYIKAIYDFKCSILPETIQRTKSGYHDSEIHDHIASATSIRKEIIAQNRLNEKVKNTIPFSTLHALESYNDKTGIFHHWELYFPFLQHAVYTKDEKALRLIHGMEEGLEHRLKKTAKQATSFVHWMELLKTKRYTWTRLQRMFVHLLTNTTKAEMVQAQHLTSIPYVRVLGMNKTGRAYLHSIKKDLEIPFLTALQASENPLLTIEERAINSYYLPIEPNKRALVQNRDIQAPIIL
ncbi:nucleotidyltransferase [Salirhabdus sp. Marseille-P4669]|uniref:nucleotidyltransferase n=1 Tax=Salirhabdus sp. Marseille-P4669 TaxID=2042310 RepID=UPI000C7AC386|nr:nucleotidyltransferase [Salirhabdus sp. Marseille-P4669]